MAKNTGPPVIESPSGDSAVTVDFGRLGELSLTVVRGSRTVHSFDLPVEGQGVPNQAARHHPSPNDLKQFVPVFKSISAG